MNALQLQMDLAFIRDTQIVADIFGKSESSFLYIYGALTVPERNGQ